MKNIFIYYLFAFLPVGIIVWLNKSNFIGSTEFACLLFAYALVYRTYIDDKRLADKNIIPKKDIWKMIIPGMHMKHFKELYLK